MIAYPMIKFLDKVNWTESFDNLITHLANSLEKAPLSSELFLPAQRKLSEQISKINCTPTEMDNRMWETLWNCAGGIVQEHVSTIPPNAGYWGEILPI
jgi:hypothetical protein